MKAFVSQQVSFSLFLLESLSWDVEHLEKMTSCNMRFVQLYISLYDLNPSRRDGDIDVMLGANQWTMMQFYSCHAFHSTLPFSFAAFAYL